MGNFVSSILIASSTAHLSILIPLLSDSDACQVGPKDDNAMCSKEILCIFKSVPRRFVKHQYHCPQPCCRRSQYALKKYPHEEVIQRRLSGCHSTPSCPSNVLLYPETRSVQVVDPRSLLCQMLLCLGLNLPHNRCNSRHTSSCSSS